jgi:rRNA processing protein Gar1
MVLDLESQNMGVISINTSVMAYSQSLTGKIQTIVSPLLSIYRNISKPSNRVLFESKYMSESVSIDEE